MKSNSNKTPNQVEKNPLRVQIIIGVFGLLGIFLTWYLNKSTNKETNSDQNRILLDSPKIKVQDAKSINDNEINQINSPNANSQIGSNNKSK